MANTTSAFVYAVLKHPEVLERVRAEADALFAHGPIDEADLKQGGRPPGRARPARDVVSEGPHHLHTVTVTDA